MLRLVQNVFRRARLAASCPRLRSLGRAHAQAQARERGLARGRNDAENVFCAGLGNRTTDERTYLHMGIPPAAVFLINSDSLVRVSSLARTAFLGYQDRLLHYWIAHRAGLWLSMPRDVSAGVGNADLAAARAQPQQRDSDSAGAPAMFRGALAPVLWSHGQELGDDEHKRQRQLQAEAEFTVKRMPQPRLPAGGSSFQLPCRWHR